jgi:hypothetical protein
MLVLTACSTTEVVLTYGIWGIGTQRTQCQNATCKQNRQQRRDKAKHHSSSKRTISWVGGILGLTASDVQLGAALPDRIPPFLFCHHLLARHLSTTHLSLSLFGLEEKIQTSCDIR